MRPFKKYKPRPIRFIELWTFNKWTIKIYTIYEEENDWKETYLGSAKEIAQKVLSLLEKDHYKIGFITIHIAKMFNQIIIDWWAQENELRHLVFKANTNTPANFKNITSSGEAFCIWELGVIGHERTAWIENVLKNEAGPDFNGYLHQVLNITE
jgi:hypothetical protein